MATAPETPDSADGIPLTAEDQQQQVKEWILAGETKHTIAKAVAQWPGADFAAIQAAIGAELQAAGEQSPEMIRGLCIERLDFLYAKMIEIGDYAGAQRAVVQLDKLARGED